jgi:hypothetical protein
MIETRAALIRQLASASLTGTLGLFIGAGYSKALTAGRAPSWGQLLQSLAADLGLADPLANPADIVGSSFPMVATQLATALEGTLPSAFQSDPILRRNEAVRRLKMEVSRKASLIADPAALGRAKSLLQALEPAWIVTTNYDFLAEESLAHPETLLPDQILRTRRGTVPVFHIHGHVLNPSSIVITEEDYVQALNPSGYRHVRLGVLFAESTTLMVGYRLGDINVQTALHYARVYRNPSAELHPADIGDVVFFNRTPSPQEAPRLGLWGEVIVDAREILDLLQEVAVTRDQLAVYWEGVKQFASRLTAEPNAAAAFVNDPNWRRLFIEAMRSVPAALATGATIQFVQQALSAVSKLAAASGGWDNYTLWLQAVLDIMELWPLGTMPPQLFEYIADELRGLSQLIEPTGHRSKGYAWAATAVWHARRDAVFGGRVELLRALRTYAERERAPSLLGILPPLP